MKILVVSQYFYPENFRINDLCFSLQQKGHEISVLTGKPNYPQGKLYEDFNNFENTELVYDNTYKVVSSSKLSIVMSGTASLEVAFTDTPQVVVYKTSNLSFILAKFLINVKYISLVNLILNKSLVRELIQNDFNHKYLLKEINYLEDPINVDKALSGYKKLREIIGAKNAADEVEKSIIKSL